MPDARLTRAAGTFALTGGAAWTAAILLHAVQPRGCVQDECLVRPEREAASATPWLLLLAAAALVAFLLTLVALLARSGDLGWTGYAGVAACGLGLAALAVAALPELRDQLRPLPMMAAIAVGLALLGWTAMRSYLVPTWAGIALLVGVLMLVGVSEQTARVLLALPLGMAWVATGVVLIRRSRGMLR